jgi:hypothetical protein
VLQAFKKSLANLLIAAFAQRHNRKAETLVIGFLRHLLILASRSEDLHQLTDDREYTAIDVLKLYGSLVSVTRANYFRNYDLQSMLSALSRSNVLTDKDISILGIAKLISQLIIFLLIEF